MFLPRDNCKLKNIMEFVVALKCLLIIMHLLLFKGTYCCIAKSPMGEIRSTTVLTLEDIQSQLTEEERLLIFATNQPPYFVKGLSSREAKINDEFQFQIQGDQIFRQKFFLCKNPQSIITLILETFTVSGKPEPKILWYRNDEPIEENERISISKESHGNYWLRLKYLEMSDQVSDL